MEFAEFKTAKELRIHYADLRHRMANLPKPPKRKPAAHLEITARPFVPDSVRLAPPPPPPPPPPKLTPFQRILAAVSQEFQLSPSTIRLPTREHSVTIPRHVVIYLASSLTAMTPKGIAVALNRLDHTTTLHAIHAMEKRMKEDPVLAARVARLRAKLLEP